MSKVGESIIQGAIEALEFAQGKDNGSVLMFRVILTCLQFVPA